MAAKNTKLTWMRPTFQSTLEDWRRHWDSAVDETYLDPEAAYIDIGRQLTPSEAGSDGRVLLWRRCCLHRLWRRRLQWSQLQKMLNAREGDGSAAHELGTRRGPPIRRTVYSFATLRDAEGMTITPSLGSWEYQNGLIYSQFYNLIKVPFDAAKQYPFQNRHLESMALDPSYLLDQHNSTRGTHAHQSRVQRAYRLGKLRIHRNVPVVDQAGTGHADQQPVQRPRHPFTYGIRAEDRVSLALLRRITDLFSSSASAQTENLSDGEQPDDPFFAVSSQTMARFLRATVNRYCFLFEHIKAQTGLKHSLPETVVMAVSLRGLRFSYGSSLLTKEPVLWGDRWTSTQRTRARGGEEPQAIEVQREGLGLGKTSKVYGFGWWLPGKFDWNVWRFTSEAGDRLAVGNDLLRQDYKRQWRILKDVRDVHVRVWQAQSWVERYQVRENLEARRLWLEYLHSTVVELFQRDVWRTALKSTKWKTGSDVTDEAVRKYPDSKPPPYCHDGLSDLFHDRQRDMSHTQPHFLTGNKLRSTSVMDLFDTLFSPSSVGTAIQRRAGWSSLPFRIATRRSLELVEMTLEPTQVTQWYAQLRRVILLTHWILPWPSDSELLTTTKESQVANLKRRLTWASIIHIGPQSQLRTLLDSAVPMREIDDAERRISMQDDLSQVMSEICRDRYSQSGWTSSADNESQRFHWSTFDLVKNTRGRIRLDNLEFGRAVEPYSNGTIFPVVETGHPPQLRMVGYIRDKTLDELERYFSELLQAGSYGNQGRDLIFPSSNNDTGTINSQTPPNYLGARRTQRHQKRWKSSRRSAEERERLRKHFENFRRRKWGRLDTDSSYSEETTVTVEDRGSDDSWKPQKRLRRAMREQS
ncbi:hypothetical protein EDB80DRAFT_783899 [Ilyonectria destructans]|nr:hypothetical protein EDB80DRAFT_783899 [Ilyonectria destructans]